MKFSFTAKIYKVGINPCVEVPLRITSKMTATKGYIPVKGQIGNHSFTQTLCPVKNAAYRLYVNGPMLKGSNTEVGDTVKFTIEQNEEPKTVANFEMPKEFKQMLNKAKLVNAFGSLTPYRQKEILRYLNSLKSKEALQRNIDKVVVGLKMTSRTPLLYK
jgi:Domain of unknown function (DUF1905)/Bacteriocin-protection, YdeI or OmpD-Associated